MNGNPVLDRLADEVGLSDHPSLGKPSGPFRHVTSSFMKDDESFCRLPVFRGSDSGVPQAANAGRYL